MATKTFKARKARTELSIGGARFYPIESESRDGKPLWVPSVTTWLSVWPKPALVPWAAKSEKNGILDEMEGWLHEDTEANRGAMLDRVLKMREAPLRYREVSRKAKDTGSSAHAWLEWSLREILGVKIGKEPALVPGADRAVKGATEWMKQVNFKPMSVEKRVYHPTLGYSGRYDLKAEVDWTEGDKVERRIVIVDWKSSKGIYDDMLAQNLAYRAADAVTANGDKSKGGVIVRLAKTADDPVAFEARQVPYSKILFDAFLAAGAFWRAMRQAEGKWLGGHASDEEVAVMQKRKNRWED